MAHPWTALGVDPDTDGGIAYLFGSSDDAGPSSALTEADPAAKASASRSSGAATAERVCSSSPQLLPERTDGLSEVAPRAIGQRVERNGQWPHGRGVAPASQDHQDRQEHFWRPSGGLQGRYKRSGVEGLLRVLL